MVTLLGFMCVVVSESDKLKDGKIEREINFRVEEYCFYYAMIKITLLLAVMVKVINYD